MKKLLAVCAAVWAAAFLLPALLTSAEAAPQASAEPPVSLVSVTPAPTPEPTATVTPVPRLRDADTSLTVSVSGASRTMTLDEYLLGVLCAEMPALYPEEALKAQAVAARTYYAYRRAGKADYGGADMSDDSSVCMAWREPASMAASWGSETDAYTARVREAVSSTDGIIMTDSEGAPIPAVFFAISSGKTESAEDIWGSPNPHLLSRDSSWDASSPGYETTVDLTLAEFRSRITSAHPQAVFSGGSTFRNVRRSSAGAVLSAEVGGVTLTGAELRSLLGLRSANFTASLSNGVYTFCTKGYGHGVGMSQYGARELANTGKSYGEILEAYYTDFTLSHL